MYVCVCTPVCVCVWLNFNFNYLRLLVVWSSGGNRRCGSEQTQICLLDRRIGDRVKIVDMSICGCVDVRVRLLLPKNKRKREVVRAHGRRARLSVRCVQCARVLWQCLSTTQDTHQTRIYPHTHAYTHMHARTRTLHAYAYAYVYAHAHAHTHTYKGSFRCYEYAASNFTWRSMEKWTITENVILPGCLDSFSQHFFRSDVCNSFLILIWKCLLRSDLSKRSKNLREFIFYLFIYFN